MYVCSVYRCGASSLIPPYRMHSKLVPRKAPGKFIQADARTYVHVYYTLALALALWICS